VIRILYITHRVPYPLDKGERIRCAHILRMFRQIGQVDLVSLMDEPLQPEAHIFLANHTSDWQLIPVGGLGRLVRMTRALLVGVPVTVAAFSVPRARELIHARLSAGEYDFIVVSNSALISLLPRDLRGTKLIVDMMDVDSRKWFSYAEHRRTMSFVFRREAILMAELERQVLNRADLVCLTTKKEREALLKVGRRGNVIVAGNGVDVSYHHSKEPPSRSCSSVVFFGALDYWPNIDAVQWFGHKVWPDVVAARRDMHFHIVGRRPVWSVRRLRRFPGITVHGPVADIRVIVCRAGIAVFPLRVVMGIPNKVLEAMALSRACIVSPQVHQVIGGRDGVHYLVASQDREWCEKILLVSRSPLLADRLGYNARAFVQDNYCWESQLRPLREFMCRTDCNILVGQS